MMGWWRTEDGRSVIGDDPVDVLIGAYREIVSGRARRRAAPLRPAVLREPGDLAPDERDQLDGALEAIRAAYRESEMERDPTAREIEETIEFAIGELEASEDPPCREP